MFAGSEQLSVEDIWIKENSGPREQLVQRPCCGSKLVRGQEPWGGEYDWSRKPWRWGQAGGMCGLRVAQPVRTERSLPSLPEWSEAWEAVLSEQRHHRTCESITRLPCWVPTPVSGGETIPTMKRTVMGQTMKMRLGDGGVVEWLYSGFFRRQSCQDLLTGGQGVIFCSRNFGWSYKNKTKWKKNS